MVNGVGFDWLVNVVKWGRDSWSDKTVSKSIKCPRAVINTDVYRIHQRIQAKFQLSKTNTVKEACIVSMNGKNRIYHAQYKAQLKSIDWCSKENSKQKMSWDPITWKPRFVFIN